MERRRLIRLVLIPVVMGLAVTLIVKQVLPAPSPTAAQAPEELAPVVVVAAKETIPERTPLTAAQLTVKQMPKAYLTGREFSSVDEVAGQVTLVPLDPGEVVLKSRVVEAGKGSLPYRIPKGMRAMTIRIDELTGVAGYPAPGDLVDLVLVLPAKTPEHPAATSRLLYEAVPVLAKGPADSVKGLAGATPAPALTSLTLALTPQQATEVALAEQVGVVKVLLRPAVAEPNAGGVSYSEAPWWQGGQPSSSASGSTRSGASTSTTKP